MSKLFVCGTDNYCKNGLSANILALWIKKVEHRWNTLAALNRFIGKGFGSVDKKSGTQYKYKIEGISSRGCGYVDNLVFFSLKPLYYIDFFNVDNFKNLSRFLRDYLYAVREVNMWITFFT